MQVAQMWGRGESGRAVQGVIRLMRYAPRYFIRHAYRNITQAGYSFLKAALPAFLRHLIGQCRSLLRYPRVGRVSFGDLRRVTPISRGFGCDGGLPIDRYYVEAFLGRHTRDIRGRILKFGDNSWTQAFGGHRVPNGDGVHAEDVKPEVTIIQDLSDSDQMTPNTFDCIIIPQALHTIYDVRSAIQTLHRLLRPGGVLLATVPGISQICRDGSTPSHHWSFTSRGVQKLLEETFPAKCITVRTYGNVLAATAFLHGLAAEELWPQELNYRDSHYHLLITLRAVKAAETS